MCLNVGNFSGSPFDHDLHVVLRMSKIHCPQNLEEPSSKDSNLVLIQASKKHEGVAGSTISTLLYDKINPKKFQVLSLGDTGFLQFFRVVSRDYGKPPSWILFFVGETTLSLRGCYLGSFNT